MHVCAALWFWKADLREANFCSADLSGDLFAGDDNEQEESRHFDNVVRLHRNEVWFLNPGPHGCNMAGANLIGAKFDQARLWGVDFRHARLEGVDFDWDPYEYSPSLQGSLWRSRNARPPGTGSTSSAATPPRATPTPGRC